MIQVHLDHGWVWLKMKQEGSRRFWSMFPFTRVPFWSRFFEPQPGTFDWMNPHDLFADVLTFVSRTPKVEGTCIPQALSFDGRRSLEHVG